jgi:hypothetical protein
MAWGAASFAGLIAFGVIQARGISAGSSEADAAMRHEADAERLAALAAPLPPPLPRSRPEAPIITGSIGPAPGPRSAVIEAVREEAQGGLLELRRRYELMKGTGPVTEAVEDWGGIEEGSWDGETPVSPAPLYLADAEAIRACEDGLRDGLPVPSSLKRIRATTGVYRAPGDDAVVTFDFEAVNGFGYPLALQAHCVFDGDTLAALDIVPR